MRRAALLLLAALLLPPSASMRASAAPGGCVATSGRTSCGYIASGPGHYAGHWRGVLPGSFSVTVRRNGAIVAVVGGSLAGTIPSIAGDSVTVNLVGPSGCAHWYDCIGMGGVAAADTM